MTQLSGVHPAISDALITRGYETLTPVQLAVIEDEFDGVDMLVSARTMCACACTCCASVRTVLHVCARTQILA